MIQSNTNVMGTGHNRGFNIPGMEPGEIIRKARIKKGLSQDKLAKRVGVSQPAIKKIEDGATRESKKLPLIAQVLDIPLNLLSRGLDGPPDALPGSSAGSGRIFPIKGCRDAGGGQVEISEIPVEYGPWPVIVERVAGAYGVLVGGHSMVPALKEGAVAVVHPHLPLKPGETFLLYSEEDGSGRAMFREIVKVTADKLLVKQYNPARESSIPRKEWRWAHRVLGNYSPR